MPPLHRINPVLTMYQPLTTPGDATARVPPPSDELFKPILGGRNTSYRNNIPNQKGDISNESKKGTFLTSLDIIESFVDKYRANGYEYSVFAIRDSPAWQ